MEISKIKKIKPFKHIKLDRVQSEISDLIDGVKGGALDAIRGFNPHVVELQGDRYIACDARTLNRHTNQGGRGDYRHLLSTAGEYAGVAVHSKRGGYSFA